MKAKLLTIAALLALGAASSALAGNGDGYAGRGEKAPGGRIVVSDGPRYMSFYDYFFNNPVKSRTLRFDRGEYYEGFNRVYQRP